MFNCFFLEGISVANWNYHKNIELKLIWNRTCCCNFVSLHLPFCGRACMWVSGFVSAPRLEALGIYWIIHVSDEVQFLNFIAKEKTTQSPLVHLHKWFLKLKCGHFRLWIFCLTPLVPLSAVHSSALSNVHVSWLWLEGKV